MGKPITEYIVQNENIPPVARKVACIDYDGTIFPWGNMFNEVPPFPGAAQTIRDLKAVGYKIVIFTSRMSPTWWEAEKFNFKDAYSEQLTHVQTQLDRWDIPYDRITCEKVPAAFYLDDKAIAFDEEDGWAKVRERLL